MCGSKRSKIHIGVENHGSVVLLRPLSDFGADWIEENVLSTNEEAQMFGGALVVEPRYLEHIICGMVKDGLEVS